MKTQIHRHRRAGEQETAATASKLHDQRAAIAAQAKLRSMASNSSGANRLSQLKALADAASIRPTAQRMLALTDRPWSQMVAEGRTTPEKAQGGPSKTYTSLYEQDPDEIDPDCGPYTDQFVRENFAEGKHGFIYVVTATGDLRLGIPFSTRTPKGCGHVDLANGEELLSAGEVLVEDGSIFWINNQSGHFQPPSEDTTAHPMYAAVAAFQRAGFDVDESDYLSSDFMDEDFEFHLNAALGQ